MEKEFEIKGQLETACPECGCILIITSDGHYHVWSQKELDEAGKTAEKLKKALAD